ncbi:MAG: hypothetical protein P8K05_04370 [Dehalococcoidia bacterium]|nr:hypothetical protein [Dehalococcoidia bacterium]
MFEVFIFVSWPRTLSSTSIEALPAQPPLEEKLVNLISLDI